MGIIAGRNDLSSVPAARLRFNGYVLDLERGCVLAGDQEITLRRKTFDFLHYFAANSGRLVSKDELLAALWPNVVVSEDSIVQCVAELRRALHDHDQRLIRTVSGRGYRFEAAVSVEPDRARPAAAGHGSDIGSGRAPAAPARAAPKHRRRMIMAGALGLLGLAAAALYVLREGAGPAAEHAAPPFSIAVLPFKSLGDDADQEVFAEGVTHDLSTELSRLPGLLVIAHASARTLKERDGDAQQVGRKLKVRYLLQGSVQRSAERLRMNVQLVSSDNGANVWAERFEGRHDELAAWQDEVVGRIATALNYNLARIERDRGVREQHAGPQASDLITRGWALVYSAKKPNHYAAARALFEQALERDPRAVNAWVGLGWTSAVMALDGWSSAPAQDVDAAETAASKALALDPNHFAAHHVRGFVFRLRGRPDAARDAFRTAISINPHFAPGHAQVGATELALGAPDAAIAAVERAIRLSPLDPSLGPWFGLLGKAELHRGNYSQAASWLARAVDSDTPMADNHAYLASALALAGRQPEAQAALAEFRKKMPTATLTNLRANAGSTDAKFIAQKERFFDGLRIAGLAE